MQTINQQTTDGASDSINTAAQQLQERIETAQSLSAICGFFSRVLEQEIDAELLTVIRQDLSEPLQQAGMQFEPEFFTEDATQLLERYAEEFTGLFVAPGCVSPFASVFETGCMFKEPTDLASAAYSAAGLEFKTRYSGEFPDHIGTMIGFYGILCEREAQALLAGDLQQAEDVKAQRDTFLLEQLAGWAPAWCRLAHRAANLPFYQQLLNMLEQLLWSELSQLLDRRELRELAQKNQREPKRLDYDADFRKASGL